MSYVASCPVRRVVTSSVSTSTLVPGGHYQIVTGGNALGIDSIPLKLPGGQYAAGREGLFLFIALGRMVTFCKEGGGMLSVWALRARSYKTRAEA